MLLCWLCLTKELPEPEIVRQTTEMIHLKTKSLDLLDLCIPSSRDVLRDVQEVSLFLIVCAHFVADGSSSRKVDRESFSFFHIIRPFLLSFVEIGVSSVVCYSGNWA